MKKRNCRKFHFKVTAKETPLWGNLNYGNAKLKVRGGEERATKLLHLVMNDSKMGNTIISRAVRRYARQHPKWWESFKLVTDMQMPDPPRP